MRPDSTSAPIPEQQLSDDSPHSWVIMRSSSSDWSPAYAPPHSDGKGLPTFGYHIPETESSSWKSSTVVLLFIQIFLRPHLKRTRFPILIKTWGSRKQKQNRSDQIEGGSIACERKEQTMQTVAVSKACELPSNTAFLGSIAVHLNIFHINRFDKNARWRLCISTLKEDTFSNVTTI